MTIAICDDDPAVCDYLTGCIREYDALHGIGPDMKILCFPRGRDFLKNPHADILFTDIYMEDLSGIDMLQSIPPRFRPRYVIVISTSREFAIDAFRLKATHYLIKPLDRKDVFEALDRCMEHQRLSPQLQLHAASGLISIPMASIIYLESFHKRTLIHTERETISTYDPLQALNEKLDDRFLQPHRSFIVSMPHIRAFYYDHLILDNDLEIMLSRKKRNELKKQYQDYLCRITREHG